LDFNQHHIIKLSANRLVKASGKNRRPWPGRPSSPTPVIFWSLT